MLGILYDNGDVCLAGDKSKLSREETFTILNSFANLFNKTIKLVGKASSEEVAKNFEEGMKDIYVTAFFSLTSGENKLYYEAVTSLKSHISDDKFVFEIKDNDDWSMSIITKPNTVGSLLNMIVYCMIIMTSDLSDDPLYLLKYADIVNKM